MFLRFYLHYSSMSIKPRFGLKQLAISINTEIKEYFRNRILAELKTITAQVNAGEEFYMVRIVNINLNRIT